MPKMASIAGYDPLARFLQAHSADAHPIPLVATHIDVTIRGGLASVTTARTFRNSEPQSIEATMTFPVPVDATLCALTAHIDGRTLNAQAQVRSKARETYEDAVERGKAAVLHDELLKGIHMLSVAHVRPGAEIMVTNTWTAPLSFIAGEPRLRIPTTVGEIYGRSPLAPSDDLVTGKNVHEATIAIQCENGTASLLRAGPAAADGRYWITLDAPIDIAVSAWTPRQLAGIAADGRRVKLDIEPAPVSDGSLDIDLLFDRSGSMAEQAVGDSEVRASKFNVAKSGLLAVARNRIKATDKLRLWEFNDTVQFVGEDSGHGCQTLVKRLSGPNGGTEIGHAFDAVIATGKAKTVLIVTDGKSWAFDPHKVARSGIRATAVLIGDDAIESGIAHLSGMTGGQAFIAAGSDAGTAISSAIEAARAPCVQPEPIEGTLSHVVTLRRGARIVASWGEPSEHTASAEARLIGATAAMLAIPLMREDAAANLAEREGIVCHLTSLVLVDEAGERQEAIPASRKIALSAPPMAHVALLARCAAPLAEFAELRSAPSTMEMLFMEQEENEHNTGDRRRGSTGLGGVADWIDWDDNPEALRNGDLSGLPHDLAALIRDAAQIPQVIALANALGIDPVVAVIALLAQAAGSSSRSAQRLARAILTPADARDIEAAKQQMGL